MQTARTVLEQKIWERRLTLQEFAEYVDRFARERGEPGTLSVRHLQRLVAGSGSSGRPPGNLRPATARLLEAIFDVDIDVLLATPARSADVAADEGAVLVGAMSGRAAPTPGVQTPEARIDLAQSFAWLDERSGWAPESTRRQVTARLGSLSTDDLLVRKARRRKVGRSRIAAAVADYYEPERQGSRLYRVRCAERELTTSVLTADRWLDIACPLGNGADKLVWSGDAAGGSGDVPVDQAVDRLAEATAAGVRVANAPLYRLLDVDVGPGRINGKVGCVPFVEYAMTMDLLENELVDALADESPTDDLHLRSRYLPDLGSAFDLPGRLCAGGVLALCAIARPAGPYRGERDFALVVQQRSDHVLNATNQLSVIPKGFHQPMTDVNADAQLTSTLLRELEEELFGRSDVDSTLDGTCAAAPLHPARMSEPLRWLTADPTRMRVVCTGFGINLVSGNFEFPCLVVIDDEEFWTHYGGEIEANWEAAGLQLFSSLDAELIGQLMSDESWSNEGLFALAQGLRHLSATGDERVRLEPVEHA
jgi:hypothetical protein